MSRLCAILWDVLERICGWTHDRNGCRVLNNRVASWLYERGRHHWGYDAEL